jgi:hypothetical protein
MRFDGYAERPIPAEKSIPQSGFWVLQNKHIAGMKEYNDYKSRLAGKNQHGPGWIYGGIDGARSLAHKYSGNGER